MQPINCIALLKKDTNNKNLGKLLDSKALGALSPHLALGASGFFISIHHLRLGKVLQALIELDSASSARYRETEVPEWVDCH